MDSFNFYSNLKVKDFKKIARESYSKFNSKVFDSYIKSLILTLKPALVIFISFFPYIIPIILPSLLTYIVIMNTFHYESLNKSEGFILSLPHKKRRYGLF